MNVVKNEAGTKTVSEKKEPNGWFDRQALGELAALFKAEMEALTPESDNALGLVIHAGCLLNQFLLAKDHKPALSLLERNALLAARSSKFLLEAMTDDDVVYLSFPSLIEKEPAKIMEKALLGAYRAVKGSLTGEGSAYIIAFARQKGDQEAWVKDLKVCGGQVIPCGEYEHYSEEKIVRRAYLVGVRVDLNSPEAPLKGL